MKNERSIPFSQSWCSLVATDVCRNPAPKKRFLDEYESSLCYRKSAKEIIQKGLFLDIVNVQAQKRVEAVKVAAVVYFLMFGNQTPAYTKLLSLFGREYARMTDAVSAVYKDTLGRNCLSKYFTTSSDQDGQGEMAIFIIYLLASPESKLLQNQARYELLFTTFEKDANAETAATEQDTILQKYGVPLQRNLFDYTREALIATKKTDISVKDINGNVNARNWFDYESYGFSCRYDTLLSMALHDAGVSEQPALERTITKQKFTDAQKAAAKSVYFTKLDEEHHMLQGLSSGEDFYYMCTLITIVGDSLDELEYKYDALEKRAKGQGMKIRRANFMMEECFESAILPLAKIHKDIKRKAQRNLLTSGVASCYPFISFEMQDPDGVMVGTNRANNSLVTIDMFDTDIHANANAVILGSSGYGKTFTAQLFALRLSEMDTQVFIISPLKGLEDYGGGCKAVDGQFISMDPSSVNSINIMDIRVPDDEDAKDMDEYSAGSLLTKKIHTIKSFMHLVVKDLTQEEEQLIDTCLIMVYKKFGITNDNNSIYDRETGQYKKMPLLQDLHKEMLKYPELHRISNILNPLITGSMACYNRPTNVDLKAKYIVFDFNGMKGAILTMSMFVVLDFVWTKIKEDRKKRKAVFIDECWKLIGTDSNEMAAEDVVEIFRTIRAYGGSAFAMTQDISQFYEYKGGKYGKAIIGNADTKIIMHLIPSEAQALQAAIQLTDAEMENVSSLQRGQGLVCSSSAKLFVDFVAADYEKQEITTDAKSFYMQEKALKEKQHQEEQARLEAEDKKESAKTDDNSEKH